jgi:hypothetical protein
MVTPGSRYVVTVHEGGGVLLVPDSKSPLVKTALLASPVFSGGWDLGPGAQAGRSDAAARPMIPPIVVRECLYLTLVSSKACVARHEHGRPRKN